MLYLQRRDCSSVAGVASDHGQKIALCAGVLDQPPWLGRHAWEPPSWHRLLCDSYSCFIASPRLPFGLGMQVGGEPHGSVTVARRGRRLQPSLSHSTMKGAFDLLTLKLLPL